MDQVPNQYLLQRAIQIVVGDPDPNNNENIEDFVETNQDEQNNEHNPDSGRETTRFEDEQNNEQNNENNSDSEWETVTDSDNEQEERLELEAVLEELLENVEQEEPLELEPEPQIDPKDGCKHYLRKCSFISPCCQKEFKCRLCHDEHYELQEDDHKLDRFKVSQIVCNYCDHQQHVQQNCEKCDVCFGTYFCSICNLFDDNDKKQYHCDKCGICRVGGRDNFIHCDTCNYCYGKIGQETHKCVENKIENKCPICWDDLHDSVKQITKSPECEHFIHLSCLQQYLRTNHKCPICSKSYIDLTDCYRRLDREIENAILPPEMQRQVNIYCNDCEKKSETKFHIFGLKCMHCESYNTQQ